MDVSNLAGRVALVTGAGSGIGRETALALARRGADLVLCDVDPTGLAATQRDAEALGRRVLARRVDVADRAAMQAFAGEVHAEHAALDLLVNNAGVGLAASFLDTPLEDWDWILGINLLGVIHGCHLFLPPMVARGRGGHVVNVASMASYMASEALAAYNVTKFGVRGLSETLRAELARHRIGVTVVCPGIINTAIARNMRSRGAADDPAVRERGRRLFERRNYPPSRVAENILRAVQRNRTMAPISPEAWIVWYLTRLTPGLARAAMTALSNRAAKEAAARPRPDAPQP